MEVECSPEACCQRKFTCYAQVFATAIYAIHLELLKKPTKYKTNFSAVIFVFFFVLYVFGSEIIFM